MSADNIKRAFLDTNIFIYMYTVSEPQKKPAPRRFFHALLI